MEDLQAYLKEIRAFMDDEGRITGWPSKHKRKLICLLYIAQKIQPDLVYSEREFNEFLNKWHTFGDHCLLRREMYNCHIVDRTSDGNYWLELPRPTLDDLLNRRNISKKD